MLLDRESWILWYELENCQEFSDSWCCRIIKEGNFEEEVELAFYELFGTGVVPLKVNFCMHCGKPLDDNSGSQVFYRDCCCKFTSLMEFIEIFDPRTAIIHRLRGNFCFNCGGRIHRHFHN